MPNWRVLGRLRAAGISQLLPSPSAASRNGRTPAPRADAAFYSKANEDELHQMGVPRVAVPNRHTRSGERKSVGALVSVVVVMTFCVVSERVGSWSGATSSGCLSLDLFFAPRGPSFLEGGDDVGSIVMPADTTGLEKSCGEPPTNSGPTRSWSHRNAPFRPLA